jgi:Uma2 family endonuclease
MAMPRLDTDWTAAQALALPDDDWRYEVLDGELVVMPPPSWAHQIAVEELFLLLHAYVREHALGWVNLSPSAVVLSERRLVQPDVFVLPRTAGPAPRAWTDITALLLAVEVLSPSTARRDRVQKRRMYQEFGVTEYWVVDPEQRVVERWGAGDDVPVVCRETLSWQPAGATVPLVIHLAHLFAVVAGERD